MKALYSRDVSGFTYLLHSCKCVCGPDFGYSCDKLFFLMYLFFKLFFFLYWGIADNNIVIAAGEQRRDSAKQIHVSTPLQMHPLCI